MVFVGGHGWGLPSDAAALSRKQRRQEIRELPPGNNFLSTAFRNQNGKNTKTGKQYERKQEGVHRHQSEKWEAGDDGKQFAQDLILVVFMRIPNIFFNFGR